jgi:hypothetical protein
VGRDAREAVKTAVLLEDVARTMRRARQFGDVDVLLPPTSTDPGAQGFERPDLPV